MTGVIANTKLRPIASFPINFFTVQFLKGVGAHIYDLLDINGSFKGRILLFLNIWGRITPLSS